MEKLVTQLIDQNTELLKGLADYSGRILQLEQALHTMQLTIDAIQNNCMPEKKYNLAPDAFYGTKELSPMLNVTSITLQSWAKNGKFPKPIIGSRNKHLWLGSDIIKWMRA